MAVFGSLKLERFKNFKRGKRDFFFTSKVSKLGNLTLFLFYFCVVVDGEPLKLGHTSIGRETAKSMFRNKFVLYSLESLKFPKHDNLLYILDCT